jgi:hypothetical protein
MAGTGPAMTKVGAERVSVTKESVTGGRVMPGRRRRKPLEEEDP